jgi:DNA polymerase III epsilon subunit-like protein/tetratricopeptide (TPR) repeat protein
MGFMDTIRGRHDASTVAAASTNLRFVTIDTETTGFQVATDRIYEIGIVTIDRSGDVLDRYETLIRPTGVELSKRLSPALQDAPSFEDVACDVLSRLQAGVVAGHVASFDLSMIDAELRRLKTGLPAVPYLCTQDLALALHIDSQSRRLANLCYALGVEMPTWHTAAGDAEATAGLLIRLLTIANDRGLLTKLSTPSTFAGSWPSWPTFGPTGRFLIRDPVALPPIGEQPEKANMLDDGGSSNTVSINIMSLIGPDRIKQLYLALAAKKVREDPQLVGWPSEATNLIPLLDSPDSDIAATAAKRLVDLAPKPFDPTEEAHDGYEKGKFSGEAGIGRLRKIINVFQEHGEDELVEAQLKLATMLRYSPKHGNDEVVGAYKTAFDMALKLGEDESFVGVEEVFWDWQDYLESQRDIGGLCELIAMVSKIPTIDSSFSLIPALVHRLRTGSEFELAMSAADRFSKVLGSVGANTAAADVCAEWAQALAENDRSTEAIEIAEQAWTNGWASVQLANRHSLLLERQRDFAEAVAICDRGLQLEPSNEQIAKRRDRCQKKVT